MRNAYWQIRGEWIKNPDDTWYNRSTGSMWVNTQIPPPEYDPDDVKLTAEWGSEHRVRSISSELGDSQYAYMRNVEDRLIRDMMINTSSYVCA